MSPQVSIRRDARKRAAEVLVRSYEGQAICHDLLKAMQAADPLPNADASLAAELAIGVSRHRLTCEHLAAHFYRGRWQGLRVPIRVILALGVYQICWLDRVPNYAAVDQAVRQAKRYGRGQAARVNAILRKVVQACGEIVDPPDDPDPRRFVAIDGNRGRMFSVPVFPDPSRRPLDYLVAATSHPPWLVERWHRRFKPVRCLQICRAGIRRPPLTLRPNTTRLNAQQLCVRITSDGFSAAISDDGTAVSLCDGTSASQLSVIREGLCQPQDLTAQTPLGLSPPRPGELLVDLCAGVGTKSTQAAEQMNNQGRIIATDTNEEKLSLTMQAAQRLGLTIIQAVPIDRLAAILEEAGDKPDMILVDVPCLNTGVLARRPEARYRAGQKALQSIVNIQQEILQRARSLAGSNTRILYSTCSLETEENEQQVEAFCKDAPQWHVQQQVLTLPDEMRDGGFSAMLVRGV